MKQSNVIAAGLALFSMFFGAGDLIWPIILGGNMGDQNFFAMCGLIITGVSLPLLGLIAMMLFKGNYHAFFGRIGKIPGLLLIFIIQAILGPIGSIPRLFNLSYATLKPYFPFDISLLAFSILASLLVLAFTIKKRRVIDLLGLVLTPLLLLSLGSILTVGLFNPPEPAVMAITAKEAFSSGLGVGYNTLDLIASFIFAPFVLSHFLQGDGHKVSNKVLLKQMTKASLIAAGLLSIMYVGLTYVSSFYTPLLNPALLPEERLSGISLLLLGPYGSIVSSIAVAMACLTTTIPLVSICGDYIKKDLLKNKTGVLLPLLITLALSCLVTSIGFMGIANMLSPILQILCPGLIVLSILNIGHKLYETQFAKTPVFVTFTLSTISYMF